MNYLKIFAFMMLLFQSTTFCSLQRTARNANRTVSRISVQRRLITNHKQISTITLAISAATAFGAFKAFRYWDTIKARKEYAQRLAVHTELQRQKEIQGIIQKVEKEKKQAQQREAQKKAAQEMDRAYSEKLTYLYEIYRSQGKNAFLIQADTFAKVNDISIEEIKKSLLAQRETIFKNSNQILEAQAKNTNTVDQEHTTKIVLITATQIQNITEMTQALEQHLQSTDKKE